jgi:hypothetical protein
MAEPLGEAAVGADQPSGTVDDGQGLVRTLDRGKCDRPIGRGQFRLGLTRKKPQAHPQRQHENPQPQRIGQRQKPVARDQPQEPGAAQHGGQPQRAIAPSRDARLLHFRQRAVQPAFTPRCVAR